MLAFLTTFISTGRLKKSFIGYLPGWLHSSKPPAQFPFSRSFSEYEAAIPLKPVFRFAHEPIQSTTDGRFIGRLAEMEGLAERILFSEGGSFLITGYRGVGKTSFINQVIRKLEDALPWAESFIGETRILDIHLNLARPLQPSELMHHIIRRVYKRLEETGIYSLLTPALRSELTLAYHRTSVNMTRKLAEAYERNFGFDEASIEAAKVKARIKMPFSFKRSRTQSFEASFLGYDDKAAENDIMQISRQLSTGYSRPPTLWRRLKRLVSQVPERRTRLKIVFIFDELDKLEETASIDGSSKQPLNESDRPPAEMPSRLVIDEMLSSMKNLFTTSGISFVFVAGKDLQERWLEDLGKGDSIYESVFSYDKYLPCMWVDMSQICDEMVDWDSLPQAVIAAPAGKVICSRCSKQNPIGSRYCRYCGTSLRLTAALSDGSSAALSGKTLQPQESTPQAASSEDQVDEICLKCGSRVLKEHLFCDSCGSYVLDPSYARTVFDDFKKYLYYKGRGIPRRTIRGFNEYVVWHGRHPVLVFSRQDIRRIRFYAKLQDVLAKQEQRLFGGVAEEVWGTQQDKRRLGVYYLVDWMLRQGDMEFTLKDAISASKRLSTKIAPAAEVAPRIISEIVDVLLKEEYLMEVQKGLHQVLIADIDARSERRYRLTHRRLAEMGGLADVFEEESFVLITKEIDISRLGNYKLQELLGKGGMATVHRAWDEKHNRLVAVKILLSDLASNPQAIERFKREADVMRHLRYPHIVQYYETGADAGRLYIAMEYVDGVSLRTILRTQERLDLDAAFSIARPLAEAIQYVHGQGFIRTDVKPDNIMINTSGRVFMLDFSIAKRIEDKGEITLSGVLVGTPHYMAPEQASGEREDPRSDIYSFGVVLYEMLTGNLPIQARESAVSTLMASAVEEPIPPSDHVELPKAVESIILKCLEKDPQKRYPAMADVIAALAGANEGRQIFDLAPLVKSTQETLRSTEESNNQATRRLKAISPVESTIATDREVAGPDEADEQSPTIAPVGPYLRVLSGPSGVGGAFSLRDDGKTSIGRSSENDIVLDSARISRFHSTIVSQDGEYHLQDLNSNNGTLVNDVMIRDEYLLHSEDRIQIGEFVLEFRRNSLGKSDSKEPARTLDAQLTTQVFPDSSTHQSTE